MKRLLTLAILVIAAVLVVNTLRVQPQVRVAGGAALPTVDADAAAQRLAGAVRIPTISTAQGSDAKALTDFAAYLQTSFPRLHTSLTREVVNGHSLLYTWKGRDERAAPVLLLAHMDVVPVEPGTEARWSRTPFGGEIADGYVWGRGTLDDKGSLMAICEAIELLLAQGYTPPRTVLLAFGHDEEIGGQQGALKIAALLQSRGVRAEWSLDEGGFVTQGLVNGVQAPVATLMTAEKGYASFTLAARDEGGHSSRPPKQTAIGRLARAVARVQDHPLPARLASPTTDMLDAIAPELPFAQRLGVVNRWLLGPVVRRSMEASPTSSALVRTTTAPTMFNAGIKDNVLPSEAKAVINFRLLPGDTLAGVEAHIRKAVDDDGIEIAPYDNFNSEPSPVSPAGSPAFARIARTIQEVYPQALVAPGLVVGATDNRHYGAVRELRYNFAPFPLAQQDVPRFHGTDERLAVADYARGVQFYARLLQTLD